MSASGNNARAALAAVRDHKDTEPVRLVRELVALRIQALKDELVTADAPRIPSLQGAILELKNLHAAISSNHREKSDKDGAYA